MSFENSNFSARKPRLAKVRKQSRSRHGRSEPVAAPAAQNGSGSNPFQSVSESFDAGKDPTVISNGFGASVADVKFGNVDNVGFVFGSSYTNSVSNLNSEQLGTKEFEKINNLGFSFGASSSNVGPNSNLKQRGSRQRTGLSSVNEFGNINNVNSVFEGTVFGTNKSPSVSNSKLEQKGSNAGHSGSYEFGKFENLGSLFGANKSSLTSNSNLEERVDRESGRKSRADDFREFDNLGFVFGSSKSNLVSNSKSENRESVGSARKSSDLEFTKFDNGFRAFDANKVNLNLEKREFVFGSNLASSASNLDSKRTEPSEKVGKFIDEWGKIKEENKPEFRKLGTEGFESGAKHTDSESNSNLGNKTENVGKLVPDARGKMKLDNGENAESSETGSFVFGQTWSDLRSKSNPEKRDSGENEGKSKHLRKFGSEGFAFSVCQSDTTSSSDFEKRESSEFAGESVFEDGCKKKVAVETRFQKSNPDGVFVFGSDKISAFSESHKLNNEMNKVTNTSDENCTSFAKTHTDNVGSEVNGKNHFVFGYTTNADSASEASPVHKLSDDMNKLNVDNNEKVCGSEKAEDCNIGSCTAENLFVFGSQRKDSVLSNGSSETTSCEFIRNLNFEGSLSGSTVEKTKKTNLETSDENAFVFTPSEENACSTDGGVSFVETKKNSSFTSMPDFGTPNRESAFSFTANLFPGLHEKLDLSSKARSTRDRRLKKTRGKLRQAIPVNPSPDTPGCCSPMDFSPYQDNSCEPSAENSTASTNGKDEDLAASMKGTETNEEDKKCRDSTEKGFRNSSVRGNAESGDVNSNTKVQENQHREQFGFASNSVDTGEINFTFSATKHRDKKKYRMKVGDGSNCTTPSQKFEFASSSAQFSPLASTSAHSDLGLGKKGEIYNSESKGERKARADEEDVKQGSETAAMEEACEKWRMRGNQAYKNGYLSKAEEFYTKGVNSIPQSKASECCLEPLVLCYSNRAATRMSRGRMREALEDCIMASALDPNFVKIQIRAANCHLALGEVEDAMKHYSKCLESGSGICLDRRIIIEAADGLQKAQKVAECTNQCAGLLRQRTSDAATKALGMIADALSLSFYSEKMFEMKGEALLMLQKYEEVIQLCEQTLEYAENNFAMVGADSDLAYTSGSKNSLVRLWRWRLMSKSYFHLGRLEAALDLLEKQELLGSTNDKSGSMTQGSSIPLAVTVRELLHFKNAGNEAFQSGRHAEAVELYTAAVLNSIESRPFSAICFCNRAAANQALGQIADAIADCSLAIALDRNYTKAVSRRATLHETIKDYEQAACDLQRYISILEEQSHEKVQHSGTPDGPSGSNVKELRQARRRLSSLEEKAKKGTSLDLYLILGVKASDTVAEIKKAYRKAALRHHPDKAGQFLARSESGDDGQLWKEITDEVHKDADRLFKMIGEAYAVLSDPTKRSEYDYEEDQRKNIQKDRNGSSGFGRPSDHYSSPFESSNRRYWQESWKTHGSSYSRW